MNFFKKLGYKCTTSRYSSKEKDDQKIDLCGIDPFHVQCKAVEALGSYHKVLESIPDEKGRYRLLFHKRTRQGTVVAMELSTFEELLEMLISGGRLKP